LRSEVSHATRYFIYLTLHQVDEIRNALLKLLKIFYTALYVGVKTVCQEYVTGKCFGNFQILLCIYTEQLRDNTHHTFLNTAACSTTFNLYVCTQAHTTNNILI
jgi:hypothetical protein